MLAKVSPEPTFQFHLTASGLALLFDSVRSNCQLPCATPIVRQSWTTLLAKSEAGQARPANTLSDRQTELFSVVSLSRSYRSRPRHLDHLCCWGLGRVGLPSSNSAASTFLSWPTSWTFLAICLKVFWKRRPSDQLAPSAFGVWCGVTESLVQT